jgi:2-dehydropantoate 2-reductase
MEELPSPLLIAGSGAMACLFAARLSAAGVPVAILANWKAGLEAIRRNGVHLVEADGSERAFRVPVIDAQAGGGEQLDIQSRYALVLVKSWQTGRTARQLAGRLAEDGLALTLQNGLGNREALAEILGEQRVALGVTTAGATLLAPGRVRPAGKGLVTLSIGPHLEPLANLLRSAGFEVEHAPDSIALLWGKLVINAAINPLTALLGVPNGELLERQTARLLLAAVACEAAAVAAAQGILLPYPDPVQAAERVARGTAANHSSMLQDVRRGTPTEVDAICGAIVAAGQRAGVPTPVNRTLWQLVKALEIRDQAKDT